MKNVFFIFVFVFAFFSMANANVTSVDDPVILTEKFDNPVSGHEGPSKSPTFVYVYQDGSTFYFGDSFAGCTVTLLLNNVEVYSGIVGIDGNITIPEDFTGTFELCLYVGSQVFSAEIEL